MNKVMLIGRLTKDPEINLTDKGKIVEKMMQTSQIYSYYRI